MLAFEDSFSPKPFTFLVNLTCILCKALRYLIKSFPCLKRRYCHCCCCRCSLVKQHMKNRRKNRQRRSVKCRNHVPTEKLTRNPNSNRYSEVMVKTRPDYHDPYDAKCFNGLYPATAWSCDLTLYISNIWLLPRDYEKYVTCYPNRFYIEFIRWKLHLVFVVFSSWTPVSLQPKFQANFENQLIVL